MIQRLQNIWGQGLNIFHPIASRYYYKDGDWQCGEILLELDVLVGCKKYVEFRGRQRQKLPILNSGPSAGWHSHDIVPNQERTEPARDGFIKQDEHQAAARTAPLRVPLLPGRD